MLRMTVFLALLVCGGPALASPDALRFHWPVDCRRGVDCLVQQYPDLDQGPAVRDPACAERSYDGHQGVDIRLISFADLARNVAVLAAADGVVLRLRDRAPERVFVNGALRRPNVKVPDCGNGLVIRHREGYETQYCHLKQGGVSVRSGQRVRAGEPIGVMGLSGRTDFPHLHVTFRRNGVVFDPYTGARMGEACDAAKAMAGDASLWADKTLIYEPVALLDAGFTSRRPAYREAKAGILASARPTASSPALVGWARLMGVARGDRLRLRLLGPRGGEIAANAQTMRKSRAVQFLFAGRRARGRWPAGVYRLEIEITRGGRRLLFETRDTTL